MKPVLIDRSLVNLKFTSKDTDDNSKKSMFMYVCALLEAGASYIELDFQSLIRLPKPSGAEKFIYRINAPEEFVVANALNFSYAVLPLKFAYILPRLELPVILEIDAGDASDPANVFNILGLISANVDLTSFPHLEMLRLTGDFDSATIPEILSTYRRRTVIPADICPKNRNLTALDSAIAAYRAGFDAVTVSFAAPDDEDGGHATLEETLIMLASMYKLTVSPSYLEGICKASLFAGMFREIGRTNLTLMMHKYAYSPLTIKKIDKPPELVQTERDAPKIRMKSRTANRRPTARVLGSMGVEQEMSDEIVKILESCSMELFGQSKQDEEEQQ
jgi:hypothetical protein